jgi:hypothetical protein
VETATFKNWQVVNRDSIQDLVRSRSGVAVLDDAARERKLAEVLAFYDDYGRGMDGMQLPYAVSCFRAPVEQQPESGSFEVEDRCEPAAEPERKSDGGDTEMLLIDFR